MLLAGLLPLAACNTAQLAPPEYVSGGYQSVSIKADAWVDARSLARAHCARFGRKPITIGRAEVPESAQTSLYTFDCVVTDGR